MFFALGSLILLLGLFLLMEQKPSKDRTIAEESKTKEKLFEINHLASEFYHYILTSLPLGKRGMEYLTQRGLNKQLIETFGIGYSPASWESLLRFLLKKGYSSSELFSAGLVVRSREGKYYDRFRGRLMFTLRDQYGNVVGFSGRKLPEEAGSLPDKQDANPSRDAPPIWNSRLR